MILKLWRFVIAFVFVLVQLISHKFSFGYVSKNKITHVSISIFGFEKCKVITRVTCCLDKIESIWKFSNLHVLIILFLAKNVYKVFSDKILTCTSIFLRFSQKGCVIEIFTQMVMFLRLLMKGLFSWAFSRQRKLLRVFTKGIKMTFSWLSYYFIKTEKL